MTTYNTGNPIGSASVKDLYDNAENLDVAVNSPTANVWADRLGQPRKTWRGIENDAQLDIAQAVAGGTAQAEAYRDESLVARDDARAAASAIGPLKFYDTYAQAMGDIGALADGDLIEVSQDETRAGARTRYKVQAGALVFVVNLDQLRLDLSSTETPVGASHVITKQPLEFGLARPVLDRLNDHLNVTDIAGADPTGVADNTGPVNYVIANSLGRGLDGAGGTYLVGSGYSNPLGKRIKNAALVKAASQGGRFRVDSYADAGQHFIGMEYLYRLFLRARNGPVITGFIYGDSTVATSAQGGGYAGADFEPQKLIPKLAEQYGNFKFSLTNRAVGGTGILDMNALPDIDVVTGSTDLFIIKYGINDAAYGLDDFASHLRSKLSAIRASSGHGEASSLSIILVGPNATFDPQHNRSSLWYEQIRGVYEQAARDYKCAYFDAYGYMRDVDWAATANGLMMMDDPYGNGQGIHPKEIMQTMIWGKLVDYVLGSSAMYPYAIREWEPLTLFNGWQAYGSGFAPPEARLVMGNIEVRGLIKGGTVWANMPVAALPWGMLPKYGEIFPVASASGEICYMRVNTNGHIEQHNTGASADYTSLSGIRCRID